jgi:hypothetical protein
MRYHFTAERMTFIFKKESVAKDVGQREHLHNVCGNAN